MPASLTPLTFSERSSCPEHELPDQSNMTLPHTLTYLVDKLDGPRTGNTRARLGRVASRAPRRWSVARHLWFHGVVVSTQDFESCDPSSSLGGTFCPMHICTFGHLRSALTLHARLASRLPAASRDASWLILTLLSVRLPSQVRKNSRVAQRKRAGPITQRSEDRNLALLSFCRAQRARIRLSPSAFRRPPYDPGRQRS